MPSPTSTDRRTVRMSACGSHKWEEQIAGRRLVDSLPPYCPHIHNDATPGSP